MIRTMQNPVLFKENVKDLGSHACNVRIAKFVVTNPVSLFPYLTTLQPNII